MCEDDPASQRKNVLSSLRVISAIVSNIDTSIAANWIENRPEMIDSICYAHKTMNDLMMENNESISLKFDLGNNIAYRHHYMGLFSVSYAIYRSRILKVDFDFDFTFYDDGSKTFFFSPPKSFLDSIVAIAPLAIKFVRRGSDETGGFRCTIWVPATEQYLRQKERELLLKIDVAAIDTSLQSGVNFVNDPARGLTYGFACGIGGTPPPGLRVFAELSHFQKTYLLEKLLYSPNPVTRLNACDALEYLESQSNYIISNEIRKRIQDIHKEQVIIDCCWGCFSESLSVHDAYLKAADSKKYLYDNFFFPKK